MREETTVKEHRNLTELMLHPRGEGEPEGLSQIHLGEEVKEISNRK